MSESFQNRPTIPEYFDGKTIAITGGTGFIGHCLVEKLLRSCPDVKKIYLLIRRKKDLSSEDRLKKLTDLIVFDKLREEQPNFLSKLEAIPCDLEQPGFDICDDDMNKILDTVQIFIHCAATLRFNEHLRLSYQVNTGAVRAVLQICRKIKSLEALVHISTAYSYCNQTEINEEVYKTGWDFDKLHDSMQWMTDDMITKLTPDILKDRPNTYTLTKAFGEEVIVNEGKGLPLCIVRPSIVGATYHDPIPGWCTNYNGSTGLLIAYGKGLLRSLMVDITKSLDIIPSDFVVSGIIAAAWKTGLTRRQEAVCEISPLISRSPVLKRSCPSCDKELQSLGKVDMIESEEVMLRRKTLPIYHLVAGSTNPVTLAQWHVVMRRTFTDYPLDYAFHFPALRLTTNKHVYWVLSFLREYIPAYVFDASLILLGRKPKLLRLTQRISDMVGVLQFFLMNEWRWEGTSVAKLQAEMTKEDKKRFNFDARTIDWLQYMQHYGRGAKKYLMKETLQGYPAARRHLQRLRILGYFMQCALFLITWRLLVSKTGFAKNLWHLFMSLWFKFLGFFQISSTMHGSSFFSRILS
uniref:Fatty acyl-CoA reductase n=1 Tax=Phallusia mammillata TaxID=59560 RepID=A0A6F9DCH8_9ASCI|nr:fatty acyl-CoA reductase 1 [Phallusia mammillata]